jgi:hypothetical protein
MNLIFRYINKVEFSSGDYEYDHPVVLCLQGESPENLRSKFWDNIAPLIQDMIEYNRLYSLWYKNRRTDWPTLEEANKHVYEGSPTRPKYLFQFCGEEFSIFDWYDFSTHQRTEPEIYTLDEWFDKFKVV